MDYSNQLSNNRTQVTEISSFFFKIITTHRLFSIRMLISYCSDIRIKKMQPCHISYHNKVVAGGTVLIFFSDNGSKKSHNYL